MQMSNGFFSAAGLITTFLLFHYLSPHQAGIVAGHLLSTLTGVVLGYYLLRKHVNYTIPGIVAIGWQETKLLLRNLQKK